MATPVQVPPPPGVQSPGGDPIADRGSSILPAPPQPAVPGAMEVLGNIRTIITAVQDIARQFPATVPMADEIGRQVQQMQLKILQSQPPSEVAAPPV